MNTCNDVDGKAARREYMRKWRRENPERVQAAQQRYWMRRALQKPETRSAVSVKDPAQHETGCDE